MTVPRCLLVRLLLRHVTIFLWESLKENAYKKNPHTHI